MEPPTLSNRASRVAAIYLASMPRTACIVAAGKFGDSTCLLKNRDRNYVSKITLVHEVKDGVEVAYLFDEKTGWVEGLNGNGVGVVNSALMVSRDESERDEVERTGKKLLDGDRILRALFQGSFAKVVESIKSYKDGLKGHTLISDGEKSVWVEHPDEGRIESGDIEGLFVRTNHGVEFPDAGYVEGPREESSKKRQSHAEKVLSEVDSPEDVAPALLRAREDRWEPTEMVRDHQSERKMRTTSQMVLDLTNKKLTLYLLPEKSEWGGIENKLPKDYEPKITIEVREYDDLSVKTEGKSHKVKKASLLPVLDPAFNLREIFKQLVLLEDHLFHARKRCPDCIWKHFLTAEALAEEAVTLDVDGKYPETASLAESIRDLQRMTRGGASPVDVAQAVRIIRKGLLGVASSVKVARGKTSAVQVPEEWVDAQVQRVVRLLGQPISDATPRKVIPYLTELADEVRALPDVLHQWSDSPYLFARLPDNCTRAADMLSYHIRDLERLQAALTLVPGDTRGNYVRGILLAKFAKSVRKAQDAVENSFTLKAGAIDELALSALDEAGLRQRASRLLKVEPGMDLVSRVQGFFSELQDVWQRVGIPEDMGVLRDMQMGKARLVILDPDVRPETDALVIKAVREAQQLLAKKGFGAVWYGPIFFLNRSHGTISDEDMVSLRQEGYTSQSFNGVYNEATDEVSLASQPGQGLMGTLIHEMGHRWWARFMTSANRAKFTDLLRDGGPVSAVSDYGATNAEEAFAEAFLHYVTGRRMNSDQLASFKAVALQRTAATTEVQSSRDFPEFKVGDFITYGKFQNKPGQVARLFMQDGIPMLEIAPVGHARRHNKVVSLYRVRHSEVVQKVASEWWRLAGDVVRFPAAPTPVRAPKPSHTIKIKGRVYALSADGGPLGDQLEGLAGDVEEEGGAHVVDMPSFMKPEPFRFLWAYNTEGGSVAMWRVTDGNEKVWGDASEYGSKIVELDRKGELNRVDSRQMSQLTAEMRKLEQEQLRRLQDWVEQEKDGYQRMVDTIAWAVFDRDVKPTLEKRLRAAAKGVTPFNFKVNESILEWSPIKEQVRVHILNEEMAKFTVERIEDEIRSRGYDPDAPGHDIQAAYWAHGDVTQAVWEKYKRSVRVAAAWLRSADLTLGPRQELVQNIKVRAKANSDGVLVRAYQGSKVVGSILCQWIGRVPDCNGDEQAIRERYPAIAKARILLVWKVEISSDLQGKGIGRALYQAAMAEAFRYKGPFLFTNTKCYLGSGTSSMAMRVWDSLAKQYPSSGHVLAVLGAPVPGSREVVVDEVGRVAARYKEKKEVPKANGKGTTTVYVYSERQVQNRNKEKAERVESLRHSIHDLREQVSKDIDDKDAKKRLTALAVALIDATFERVGNDESADDGHFGVTGWLKKHVTFGKGKATIKYVGKSGVDHEKVVDDSKLVTALKECCEDKGAEDAILSFGAEDSEGLVKITSRDVNEYLKPFEVTAKDLRGFHANREMQDQLRALRKKGPELPKDRKEKDQILKDEFKKALEATAEAVGHEAATLRSQYLVPGLEDAYMKDGTVIDNLKDASVETHMSRTAIIHVDNATDGPEGSDLRGQVGVLSSLTLLEQAVVEDMLIHGAHIHRIEKDLTQVGRRVPAGAYMLRGHMVRPDVITELNAAGYLAEVKPGEFAVSPKLEAKLTLYRNAANRVAAQWLDHQARVEFSGRVWVSAPSRKLDKEQQSDIWGVYVGAYQSIGMSLASIHDLTSENPTLWCMDLNLDDKIDAFISYKTTAYGNKITFFGASNLAGAKREVIMKVIQLVKSNGWYIEGSHKVAQLLEASGVAPIDSEVVVREVLRKDITWLGAGKYQRVLGGVGVVTKSLYGHPRGVRVATKSPSEREDEETERLVRTHPDKKPPRNDSKRNTVDSQDDPDLDNYDKDLSLNYKDV